MGGKLTNNKRISSKKAIAALSQIQEVLGHEGVHVAGSVRRGKTVVGDLDIIVVRDQSASDITFRLKDLTGVDLSKRKQISFVLDEVQVDLNICTDEVFGTYLMHWTGSIKENIRLRARAKRLGMKLSQNGLINSEGVNLAINCTEEEVYELLGCEFVEPSKR